jgi:co-chaperonin GroES (HSP10)
MVKPLSNRIVVKPVGKQLGNHKIVIPETAVNILDIGVIISVGAGRYDKKGNRIKPWLKPGDVVLFKKHLGQQIKVGEDTCYIMRDTEVLGKIEETLKTENS